MTRFLKFQLIKVVLFYDKFKCFNYAPRVLLAARNARSDAAGGNVPGIIGEQEAQAPVRPMRERGEETTAIQSLPAMRP